METPLYKVTLLSVVHRAKRLRKKPQQWTFQPIQSWEIGRSRTNLCTDLTRILLGMHFAFLPPPSLFIFAKMKLMKDLKFRIK